MLASHVDQAASEPGTVTMEAEAWKHSKYTYSLAATYYFVPVTSRRRAEEETTLFISDLSRQIVATAVEP